MKTLNHNIGPNGRTSRAILFSGPATQIEGSLQRLNNLDRWRFQCAKASAPLLNGHFDKVGVTGLGSASITDIVRVDDQTVEFRLTE